MDLVVALRRQGGIARRESGGVPRDEMVTTMTQQMASQQAATARSGPPADALARTAYLGLGSNLDDRVALLGAAVQTLRALAPALVITAVSSLYDTAPQLVTEQPRFLNLVVEARTTLDPEALLRAAKRIEADLGRIPGPRYGPRRIDIDVLLYDDLVTRSADLVIPHPRLAERAFALFPLAELAPTRIHPTLGTSLRALAKALDGVNGQDVRRVGTLPAASLAISPPGTREHLQECREEDHAPHASQRATGEASHPPPVVAPSEAGV